MASLRKIKDSFFVRFRLAGRQFERWTWKPRSQPRAEASRKRIEATVLDIRNGRITLPEEPTSASSLCRMGASSAKQVVPEVLALSDLFQHFDDLLPEGAMEPNSLTTHRIHRKHLMRILGAKKAAQGISTADLQAYVNMRCKEGVVRDTIKKEISTFGSIWTWGTLHDLLTGPCRTRGLKYPKAKDKPPFLTWGEIETAIAHGGLSDAQIDALWDCLFLDTDQIADLLAHVKATARQPFVFPMFAFVALTGCRRSEMMRSERKDVKIENGKVTIREKKRDRSIELTHRCVNLHPFLAQVLSDWFRSHPGGMYTFCQRPNIALTIKEVLYHFKRTLAGSKLEVLRGYHVFRHSFASNLARAGKDQRVIDEFLGHQTEQMRKRYRHLFPDTKQDAIEAAFGSLPRLQLPPDGSVV